MFHLWAMQLFSLSSFFWGVLKARIFQFWCLFFLDFLPSPIFWILRIVSRSFLLIRPLPNHHPHLLPNHRHLRNFRFLIFHWNLVSYLRMLSLTQRLLMHRRILRFWCRLMINHRFINLGLVFHFILFYYLFNFVRLIIIRFLNFLQVWGRGLLFTQRLILFRRLLLFQRLLSSQWLILFQQLLLFQWLLLSLSLIIRGPLKCFVQV